MSEDQESAKRTNEPLGVGSEGSHSPIPGGSQDADPPLRQTDDPDAKDKSPSDRGRRMSTDSPVSDEEMAQGAASTMLKSPLSPKNVESVPNQDIPSGVPSTKGEYRSGESTPSAGSPICKIFPCMSEREFISRLGSSTLAKSVMDVTGIKEPIRVLLTAATSDLSYLMLIPLARGDVFGTDQSMFIHLYDEGETISDLHGIAMEIEDCSFSLVKQVIPTGEDEVAFLNVDFAFLNDSMTADGDRPAFERIVQAYAGHGKALDAYAKKTVKVIVSGSPVQTNTFICVKFAKTISSENFTGLARLNHNRAVTMLSQKLGVIPNKIINMIVWGNKGTTLYPDYSRSVVVKKARRYRISDLISKDYLDEGLPEDVRLRESLLQKLTKQPGLMSRAKAACDQMRDWWIGLPPGQFVSMSVFSDGIYGVATDIVFTYPVFIDNKQTWRIVQGLTIGDNLRACLDQSSRELEQERDQAVEICTELGL
ncbi:malate dehydrogenase, cytoplasmic-like [Ixodes scapularis]